MGQGSEDNVPSGFTDFTAYPADVTFELRASRRPRARARRQDLHQNPRRCCLTQQRVRWTGLVGRNCIFSLRIS